MKDAQEEERIAYVGVEVPTAVLMAEVEANYLDEWISLATNPREGKKATSTKAARELCATASVCLARDHPMPDGLREYMAQALKAIAEGESANVALGVPKGRPGVSVDPMDQILKERMIAWFVRHLIRLDGLSEAKAKEHACQQFYLDTRTVELYWARHRESAQAKHFFHEENEIIYGHLCKARAK